MANEKALLMNQLKGEGREVIDWELYDSLATSASATQSLSFFQNTIGSVGRVRTNMQMAGALASPKTFYVWEIGCRIINPTGAAFFHAGGASPTINPLSLIFNTMNWEFRLDPSTEYEGQGIDFFDAFNYMNDTGTTLGVGSYPNALQYKTIKLKSPIVIPATRAFALNATVTTPSAAQGYSTASLIYFFLKGKLRRNA